MQRDYSYFCPNDDHSDTFVWSLEEFDKNKDTVLCPICKKHMLVDLSTRKIKDNSRIGNKTCLTPTLNYSKASNGRDGRSYF